MLYNTLLQICICLLPQFNLETEMDFKRYSQFTSEWHTTQISKLCPRCLKPYIYVMQSSYYSTFVQFCFKGSVLLCVCKRMWFKPSISGHTTPMWTPNTHSHPCALLVFATERAICHIPLEARWSHVWPRPGLRTSAELTALQKASMGNSGNCGSGKVHLPCTHEAAKYSTALRTNNLRWPMSRSAG